jgi:hypothetical protein
MKITLPAKLVSFFLVIGAGVYDFPMVEKSEVRKTFTFTDPSATKWVELDNLNGDITVAGYAGKEVQLVVYQTFSGRTPDKIKEAREKITLDISQEKNTIKLFVDDPCRDDSRNRRYRDERHAGFSANFDFDLKVPHETSVFLRTVNDGEIAVKEVLGDYDIENINGGIEMLEAGGSGRVYALNGEVKVVFKKNPSARSYFGSLNGDVDVTFLPDLAATFRVKTFNGEVYSDFSVTQSASIAPIREQNKGKSIYKYDRTFGVQVGKGGPEIELDAFNGDIHIIKRER